MRAERDAAFGSKRNRLLVAAMLTFGIGAALATVIEDNPMQRQFAFATGQLPIEGELPSLSNATAWLDSEPLTQDDLHGKVVLIEFWTYSCINWLRVQPYVRAWAEKYGDDGLVVIGVHSPEFGFEKNVDNVRWAAKELRVGYPIAIDSDHAIWRAFNNHYWPALYFVDAEGRIRHHQFGEGDYEQSERTIQKLLAEPGLTLSTTSSFQSMPAGQKPPQIGTASRLPRPMSALRAPRILRRQWRT